MLEQELNKSLGAEQFAVKWNEQLKMASCSEAMKPSLADAAMTAWQRVLQDPDLRDLLLCQEQVYDPPVFDSIYKYEAIIKKCNTFDNIRWTIGALLDLVAHHGTASAEFSVRQLSGKGLPGGKGKIELMLAKKDLARAFHCHAVSMRYSEQLLNYLDRWCGGSTFTGKTWAHAIPQTLEPLIPHGWAH